MKDRIKSIGVFSLTVPRSTPYLGSLQAGESPNPKGYFVRNGNRTVYPVFDRSVVVRIETEGGVSGWGETYGLVAPGAVAEIINDLLAGFLIGRDPSAPSTIYDDFYDLMRVRGYTGGFYVDALAAIDIALWDIAGKQSGKSIAALLGGEISKRIPAYMSGLPERTLGARIELAQEWIERGFNSFKFATPVANEGVARELRELRSALGADARIAVDMHWNQSADEALDQIAELVPHDPWFVEAPVRTEDIEGLEAVCRKSDVPIAVGEEWRTHHDFLHRLARCRLSIVQPEMGHKGITNFLRIGDLAKRHEIEVIPHATIGAGIFLAASLQASSVLEQVTAHEFQHSIFELNRTLLKGTMDCRQGSYSLPDGPGLGVELSEEALGLLEPI